MNNLFAYHFEDNTYFKNNFNFTNKNANADFVIDIPSVTDGIVNRPTFCFKDTIFRFQFNKGEHLSWYNLPQETQEMIEKGNQKFDMELKKLGLMDEY